MKGGNNNDLRKFYGSNEKREPKNTGQGRQTRHCEKTLFPLWYQDCDHHDELFIHGEWNGEIIQTPEYAQGYHDAFRRSTQHGGQLADCEWRASFPGTPRTDR
jgi:inosine/xanthosine triphosphate pyrophosphatase family protein